ncbi:MAG TPA: hypothetical protein VFE60_02235 [Roseiarcus sp.]|nr:hypothetical protein [Roseiarcus sp.]
MPYLTGAFAGTGGFTVSKVLGYQPGGLNADGSQNTTSRQFQAGLSVTGKGTAQNATLFGHPREPPGLGKSNGRRVRNLRRHNVRNSAPTPWFGLASGSVSSATPSSSSNTVSTMDGTPIAGFALNNTNTNLSTGAVSNSQSSNFVQPGGTTSYTFNPVTTGTPTFSAGAHPDLHLNGYVGGVMVTATGGTRTAPTKFTTPYVVTNVTGQPGNVSIQLPGSSSEVFAVFNVGPGPGAPTGAMTSSSHVFGSTNADRNPLFNGARSAYVNPSNFAAQDAVVSVNGVSGPASSRNGTTVGFANQQLVTAGSVGANTPAFLSSISTLKATPNNPFPVTPCACQTQWGFWSAFNGGTDKSDQPFQDQGALLLWVAGTPSNLVANLNLPATGVATYAGHAIANIANPNNITSYLAAGTFSNAVNFGTGKGAVTIGGLDATNYAGTVQLVPKAFTFNGTLASTAGSPVGRTAALNGSFFQGATSPFGEVGGSLILNGPGSYLGSGIFLGRKP